MTSMNVDDAGQDFYEEYRLRLAQGKFPRNLPGWRELDPDERAAWNSTVEATAHLSLGVLSKRAGATATAHGFTDATVAEEIALMHSELSEALEDHRAGHEPSRTYYERKIQMPPSLMGKVHEWLAALGISDPPEIEETVITCSEFLTTIPLGRQMPSTSRTVMNKPCGIPTELADVVIRIFHFADKHGLDLPRAVREKMVYNDSRPFKHGKVL